MPHVIAASLYAGVAGIHLDPLPHMPQFGLLWSSQCCAFPPVRRSEKESPLYVRFSFSGTEFHRITGLRNHYAGDMFAYIEHQNAPRNLEYVLLHVTV